MFQFVVCLKWCYEDHNIKGERGPFNKNKKIEILCSFVSGNLGWEQLFRYGQIWIISSTSQMVTFSMLELIIGYIGGQGLLV